MKILAETPTSFCIEWAGIDPKTGKSWTPTWEPKESVPDFLYGAFLDANKHKYLFPKSIIGEDHHQYHIEWEGLDPTTHQPWSPSWVSKTNANVTPAQIQDWETNRKPATLSFIQLIEFPKDLSAKEKFGMVADLEVYHDTVPIHNLVPDHAFQTRNLEPRDMDSLIIDEVSGATWLFLGMEASWTTEWIHKIIDDCRRNDPFVDIPLANEAWRGFHIFVLPGQPHLQCIDALIHYWHFGDFGPPDPSKTNTDKPLFHAAVQARTKESAVWTSNHAAFFFAMLQLGETIQDFKLMGLAWQKLRVMVSTRQAGDMTLQNWIQITQSAYSAWMSQPVGQKSAATEAVLRISLAAFWRHNDAHWGDKGWKNNDILYKILGNGEWGSRFTRDMMEAKWLEGDYKAEVVFSEEVEEKEEGEEGEMKERETEKDGAEVKEEEIEEDDDDDDDSYKDEDPYRDEDELRVFTII